MAKGVRIFTLDTEGNKREVGILYLHGRRVAVSKPWSPLLRNILRTPVHAAAGDGRLVTAKGNAEEFLENLCHRHKSPSLWATRVEEIDVPPRRRWPRLLVLALAVAAWLALRQAGQPMPFWAVLTGNVLLLVLLLWTAAGDRKPAGSGG